MSVRGSKNKIIVYIAGACSIAFVILLYHNASQRLEAMEVSYERCHLNEESLSAQLQVNLEYKVRLEKSLQQEKSDHAQTKEELQNKLEDERQLRERENVELIALQKQYKNLQSKHETADLELNELRKLQTANAEERTQLEEMVKNLKSELSLIKQDIEKDSNVMKVKITKLEEENSELMTEKRKLIEKIDFLQKFKQLSKTSPSDGNILNHIPFSSVVKNNEKNESVLHPPNFPLDGVSPSVATTKSSVFNKLEKEIYPSANSYFANTSTPMINPQAVQDEEKLPIVPMPQPRPESSSNKNFNFFDIRENQEVKPQEFRKENEDGLNVMQQNVLRAPELLQGFAHVPQVDAYKKQLKDVERNDHGGEVGDEEEPLVRNPAQNQLHHWRDDLRVQPLLMHPAVNEIPRNPGYQYPAEDEGRKEEGEDEDDGDAFDYRNPNEKSLDAKETNLKLNHIQLPFANKRDSVMLQPK